ncbi:hypothetical protein M0R04_13935 [Candidatus Dojkabacteria bacterium]|jgi:hypothetical protein|nr:hypothetical protein [Candidatus Dojkabacteria bacterium]
MKKLNEYRFKNKKAFIVYFLDKKDKKKMGFPECDDIYLTSEEKGELGNGYGIRPDEALMLAKMLIDAVYKLTDSYGVKLLKKGYYGYKEFHKHK